MNHLTFSGCVSTLLLLAAFPLQAQGVAPAPAASVKADARDARARVPAATHVSPLATYRMLGDTKIRPWREANDEVERIGGWRTYLREASSADAPASSATPRPSPAAQGAGTNAMDARNQAPMPLQAAPTPPGSEQAMHQHAPRPNPSK